MTKAYSYLRFSTPRQEWGDSTRRQTDMARSYAERHGLELADEELADRGVSGYSGANMDDASALGAFTGAVYSGHVEKGSILLVEALDRLSRQAAWRASTLLGTLCLAGLTVVTLNDERVYSAVELDRDEYALFFAVVGFMRGHDESRTKARRLRATWDAKRKKVARGEARLTTIAPAWLQFDAKTNAFLLREDRAEVVRRIFAQTLEGVGRHTIAAQLNAEGVPTFGRSKFWRATYLATILANPAAVGTLVPERSEMLDGKRVRPKCDEVPGYFPAVVSDEDFQRVQAMRTNARAPQRGRHANAPLVNPFAGLLKCSRCGSTVLLVSRGVNRSRREKGFVRIVVCEKAKSGAGCVYRSVRLEKLINALRHEGPGLAAFAPAGGKDATDLDRDIDDAERAVAGLSDAVENLLDAFQQNRSSHALTERLRLVEAELTAEQRRRDDLLARRAGSAGPLLNRKLQVLEDALSAETWEVVAVNAALRQCFRAAVLDTEAGRLTLEWAHGGTVDLIYDYGFKDETRGRKK